jgi:hypothetical protein
MNESTYKSYFLGAVTEESAAEIELRVLEDAEFAAELAVVEENLIEDFLDNSLSSEDANLFLTNYLSTEERLKDVEMTALMKRFVREDVNSTFEVIDSDPHKDSGFFAWFGSRGSGLPLAAAAAALIAVMTSVWFILRPQPDNELIALQNRYEQINQNPNSVSLDTRVSELTLVSGNLRASGWAPELSRPALTEDVRFRIALPPQTDNSTSYHLTVFRDGTDVFHQKNIRPLANPAGTELRLLLPQEILPAGNYRINLQAPNTPDLNYSFVIR